MRLRVRVHREAGAVEAARRGTAAAIAIADLLAGDGDDALSGGRTPRTPATTDRLRRSDTCDPLCALVRLTLNQWEPPPSGAR